MNRYGLTITSVDAWTCRTRPCVCVVGLRYPARTLLYTSVWLIEQQQQSFRRAHPAGVVPEKTNEIVSPPMQEQHSVIVNSRAEIRSLPRE